MNKKSGMILGIIISVLLTVAFATIVALKMNNDKKYEETIIVDKINVIYNEGQYVVNGIPREIKITMSGKEEDVLKAKKQIKEITFDLSNKESGKYTLDVEIDKVSSVDYEISPKKVELTIEAIISRVFDNIRIEAINLAEGYNASLVIPNGVLSVLVRGPSDDINNLTSSDIRVYVDLKDITTIGNHALEIKCECNNKNITIHPSFIEILVNISKKN